jgi:hypothetical protein
MEEQSPVKQNVMATEEKEKERDGGRLSKIRATASERPTPACVVAREAVACQHA